LVKPNTRWSSVRISPKGPGFTRSQNLPEMPSYTSCLTFANLGDHPFKLHRSIASYCVTHAYFRESVAMALRAPILRRKGCCSSTFCHFCVAYFTIGSASEVPASLLGTSSGSSLPYVLGANNLDSIPLPGEFSPKWKRPHCFFLTCFSIYDAGTGSVEVPAMDECTKFKARC
jgi:hypothetical protein